MLKKINEFFGYAFFAVGALKIALVILILLKLGVNLTSIFNGGYAELEYFPTLTTVSGFIEIGLIFGAIIMIIVNIKKQPEVITGYMWGLGGILIELVLPPIMAFFALFVQCSMLMKAGSKIRSKNSLYENNNKTTKRMIKNTDWFYNNQSNSNEKIKEQNKDTFNAAEKSINNEETKKINTILIISVTILIIIILGIFFYKMMISGNNNESAPIAKTQEIDKIDSEAYEKNKENSNEIEKYNETLKQIANEFNNSSGVTDMKLEGNIMEASVVENGITLFYRSEVLNLNIEFMRNKNILSAYIMYNHTDSRINTIELLLAMMLVDSISETKGYPENLLFSKLTSEEVITYTIENEGIEFEELENRQGVVIKIDLDNDFSFLNQ